MSASEEQLLRQRVVMICNSEACAGISFNIDGTTVSGTSFKTVSKLISSNKIRIKVEKQEKDVGASYEPRGNFLSFPTMNFGVSLFEMSMIVHECVHAWIDASKRKTLSITDELCAYTAQYTYLQNFLKVGLLHYESDENSITLAADIVAKHVVAGVNLNVPPAALDVSNLRYALYLAPIYQDMNKLRNDYSITDGV